MVRFCSSDMCAVSLYCESANHLKLGSSPCCVWGRGVSGAIRLAAGTVVVLVITPWRRWVTLANFVVWADERGAHLDAAGRGRRGGDEEAIFYKFVVRNGT